MRSWLLGFALASLPLMGDVAYGARTVKSSKGAKVPKTSQPTRSVAKKAAPAPKAPAPARTPTQAPKASPAPAPRVSPAPRTSPAPAPRPSAAPAPSGVPRTATVQGLPAGAPIAAPGAARMGAPAARVATPGVAGGTQRSMVVTHTGRGGSVTAVHTGTGHTVVSNRPYTGRVSGVAASRSSDHRFGRPLVTHVGTSRYAHFGVPHHHHYHGWYSGWYVHPWYRWNHATTLVVSFGFPVYAWSNVWIPPSRAGWLWVPGGWAYGGYWAPGYWAPMAPIPVGYVYAPGWWERDVYVEGHYRVSDRSGWDWVDGFYLEDGTYVRGYWQPTSGAPDGYAWEPGFYDGESWIDGFWRPEFRDGYAWTEAYFDGDGVFRSGYWMPTEQRPGFVWVPGWFDGNEWVAGYWITEAEYGDGEPGDWEPEEGWDAGWGEPPAGSAATKPVAPTKPTVPVKPSVRPTPAQGDSEDVNDRPLALPVEPPA